ncbi:uncharacterized protein [Palaemon carinicauda]|uniref:uncharacterized protein n=1 Tax=Palaemon carinicauda TaxID=392227 RepID=UPI0035B57B96
MALGYLTRVQTNCCTISVNRSISTSHMKNSVYLCEKLQNVNLTSSNRLEKLKSFDVTSLFTKVPVDDLLDFQSVILDAYELPLPTRTVIELIFLCIKKLIPSVWSSQIVWYRFLDDVLGILEEKFNLEGSVPIINLFVPSIKITIENEENKSIPFLDVLIIRQILTRSISAKDPKEFQSEYNSMVLAYWSDTCQTIVTREDTISVCLLLSSLELRFIRQLAVKCYYMRLETSALKREEEGLLARTKMRMVSQTDGISLLERRESQDLRRIYGMCKVKERARDARLRYYGHMIRREDVEPIKIAKNMPVIRRRNVGRQQIKWRDVVKMHMGEMGLGKEDTRSGNRWKKLTRAADPVMKWV